MKQLLASLLVLSAAPFPMLAQCSDSDKKALEAFDKAWSEATTSGNRAQLQTILADDFASATPTGTVNKAATIDGAVATAERTRANPQSASRTIYDNYVITCTPVVGTVTHRTTIMTTVNGKEQTTYSRSVHVMEKRAGRWQVVSNAGHPLTDAQIVLYLENDWNDAIKKHDAAWIERNYADDATDVSSRTGALMSKAAAIADARNDKSVVESIEFIEANARVDGNTAVVTGIFRDRGRDDSGKPYERRVRFTDTWIKRDGRWQVWATQGLVMP
jgi:ketosteroid isomerase-like protein